MLRMNPEQRPISSWRSLFRTARAPIGILVIAALSLVLPSQTGDELMALRDMHVGPFSGLVTLQFALAFFSLSSWYWARAALSARFGVDDTLEGRAGLRRCGRLAFNAVPRMIFLCGVALSVSQMWRGFSWFYALPVAVWAVPAYLLIHWRLEVIRPLRRQRRVHPEQLRSRCEIRSWLLTIWPRLKALVMLAPFSPIVASLLLIVALGVFFWGALESFLPVGENYPGPASLAAQIFPGPAAVIMCLALMIGPLTALVFVMDGLRLEVRFLGRFLGFTRPPVVTALLAWIAVAPLLFSLHTVRVLASTTRVLAVDDRRSLDDFFDAWASACITNPDRPVRPIVVAISGGASRAAIWGAQVLEAIDSGDRQGNAAVFAVSSVSGGSLGAAAYFAVMRADDRPCQSAQAQAPVAEQLARLNNTHLGGDALGPLLAGSLLSDTPRSLLSPIEALIRLAVQTEPRGGDRAEALERAFEHLWRSDLAEAGLSTSAVARFSDPFLSLFYDRGTIRPGMPVWVLNGTDLTTGGRMLTVPFGARAGMAWPFYASMDVLGLLGADVPISTAINNSARFPYLEPTGEVVSVDKAPSQFRHGRPEILDGGYFDNEGLESAWEIAEWLKQKTVHGQPVQPIIVQATANADIAVAIANRVVRCPDAPVDIPTDPSASPETLQLLAPVVGAYNVRGAHAAVLLRRVRDEYCGPDRRAFWPELTNWPSGTHSRTKLERPGSAIEADQAVAVFGPALRSRLRLTANT